MTDAGNLSLRKLTKSDKADLYKLLVAGYVLVTIREAFAVAPSLLRRVLRYFGPLYPMRTAPADLSVYWRPGSRAKRSPASVE